MSNAIRTTHEVIPCITPETLDATVRAFEAVNDAACLDDDVAHNLAAHIVHQVEALSGVEFKIEQGKERLVKTPLS